MQPRALTSGWRARSALWEFASSRWARLPMKKRAPRFREQIAALGGGRRRSADARNLRLCRGTPPGGTRQPRREPQNSPSSPKSRSTRMATASMAPIPETFAARLAEWNVDVTGHQLQRRPGRHAGCHRARTRRDFPASCRPAKCRHATLGGRPEYLPLLAGIHGELHPKICSGRSAVWSADVAAPRPITSAP